MSYRDFYAANLRAPIVQFHIDYYQPLILDEEFTIKTSLIWDEAARLNTEYELIKQGGSIATRGYTVQMFVDGSSTEPRLVSPDLLERCRQRWKAGEFKCLH
jgi:acyl-CoA thioester hydrolase